jgi:C1A family cysteine protease
MKLTLVFLASLAACYALSLQIRDQEFDAYLQTYQKYYTGAEYATRLAIFKEAKEEIARLNAEARSRGRNTKFAINKFADLSKEEFAARYFGYKKVSKEVPVAARLADPKAPLPTYFDWNNKGAVTPVKDQQQCGSCWAFSATEGVESAWFLAKRKLIELSPQQIVSCDTTDQGCNGGDLPTAFAYIASSGLETEADYPYTSGNGDSGTCNYNQQDTVASISGFKYATTTGNETAMQVAMLTVGPLSICVEADTWQYYSGGVLTNDCGDNLDHCVQVTGWNVDNTQNPPVPYWIVRNSWNTNWGINGYIWIERNMDLCGISDEATYVTI